MLPSASPSHSDFVENLVMVAYALETINEETFQDSYHL
jgi:hypothetical protein